MLKFPHVEIVLEMVEFETGNNITLYTARKGAAPCNGSR